MIQSALFVCILSIDPWINEIYSMDSIVGKCRLAVKHFTKYILIRIKWINVSVGSFNEYKYWIHLWNSPNGCVFVSLPTNTAHNVNGLTSKMTMVGGGYCNDHFDAIYLRYTCYFEYLREKKINEKPARGSI